MEKQIRSLGLSQLSPIRGRDISFDIDIDLRNKLIPRACHGDNPVVDAIDAAEDRDGDVVERDGASCDPKQRPHYASEIMIVGDDLFNGGPFVTIKKHFAMIMSILFGLRTASLRLPRAR
jgi:hypothetical protein